MNTNTELLTEQRTFFSTGRTRPIRFRRDMLGQLLQMLTVHESRILNALQQDLGKPHYEGFMSELGLVRDEIRHARRHVHQWAKPVRVRTPWIHWPASSRIHHEPYGLALIIAPWNYPVLLAMAPLIGSMAAGNCTVVKPSEMAPATSHLIAALFREHFPAPYIAVVEGDAQTSTELLNQRFDTIFFTGSPEVGRIVMAAAARHLTPVTLELGGKSPCIVDRDVNLDLTAKRIVSGKFLNAGQTCIAPDYLLVHHRLKDDLVVRLKHHLRSFYGKDVQQNPDYSRIISHRHFDRLARLLQHGKIIFGGQLDQAQRFIAPTLVDQITWDDPIMQEEIFGPILPILTYTRIETVLHRIERLPKPLAFYLFTNDRALQRQVVRRLSFGTGCINDTMLQFTTPYLPFGGVGHSGMGSYHGKASFDTFSHSKSLLKRTWWGEAPLRYPPYRRKMKWLRRVLR